MARKRAPGAGRKPKGEFKNLDSPFSFRMPKDLRAQLDTAAKKSGRSVSQQLLSRLQLSFIREREKSSDPAARALGYLISQIAGSAYLVPGWPWHRDRFMFRTFKLGVAKLLDALEPPGEERPPFGNLGSSWPTEAAEKILNFRGNPGTLFDETYKTPEIAAGVAASTVLHQLFHSSQLTPDQKELVRSAPGIGDLLLEMLEHTSYAMSDARRDLGIDESKEQKS